ncbi:hypothetical protein BDR07DRAFT_1497469 [Suillus spraguei]|nr:hypothetical protein BDR07DRAFT_1497469 [Suillus spraguei]
MADFCPQHYLNHAFKQLSKVSPSLSNSDISIRHTHTVVKSIKTKPPVAATASQSPMKERSKALSNHSSSPASSQTCVELSSSFHKDKEAGIKSEHIMDIFSSPKLHSIPSSPREITFPDTPSCSRGASTKSPLTSPTKPRFHPYLKSRGTAAATAQFALDSLQGQNAHELNPGAALMAKEIFTRGLADLSDDMLRDGAMAQYATCEVARQELITATWKVEASTRWSKFLMSAREHLKTQHDYSKTDLEIWERACTNRGIKDLFHDGAFYDHSTTQGTLTLAVLQEQARQLKEYVEERGADADGDRSEGGSDYESSGYASSPSFHDDRIILQA